MRSFLIISASLSLAACGQQDSAPPPAPKDEAQAPEAKPVETPELAGAWRVTAIDGQPVEDLAASFSGNKASLSAGCVRRGFAYTQKRNTVSFTPDPGGSANCEGRGTSGEHATAADALQQASIVIFNKDGSEANLSGTGGNLTLRRR